MKRTESFEYKILNHNYDHNVFAVNAIKYTKEDAIQLFKNQCNLEKPFTIALVKSFVETRFLMDSNYCPVPYLCSCYTHGVPAWLFYTLEESKEQYGYNDEFEYVIIEK